MGAPAGFIERMLEVLPSLEGSPSAYWVVFSPTHRSWLLPSPPHLITSVPSLPHRLLALSDLALLGHGVARVERLQSGESDWLGPAPLDVSQPMRGLPCAEASALVPSAEASGPWGQDHLPAGAVRPAFHPAGHLYWLCGRQEGTSAL